MLTRSRFALAATALMACAAARAVPVDLELSLVVDTSGSISDAEYRLQVDSYADLVRDPSVIPQDGTVAIHVVLFASGTEEAVPWTLVADAAAAEDLSRAIRDLRRLQGSTSLGDGLLASARTFEGNGFEGARRVIDVSGDGPVNSGTSIRAARTEALSLVDAINGLPMTTDVPTLDDYYRDEVIGGEGSFAYEVVDAVTFRDALRAKLLRETGGCVLAPAPLAAWYPLDETSGNVACDAEGGAPAWLSGCPEAVPGRVAGARRFDGVDDRGSAPAPALQAGAPFTVAAWVRTSALGRRPVLDALEPAQVSGFALALVDGVPELTLGAGGGASCDAGPGSACRRLTAPAFVADDAWHLLAARVDPSAADGGALFVDGARVATFDATFLAGAATGPGPLLAGAGGVAAGEGLFAGELDELQVYAAALDDAQVAAIHAAGPSGLCRWSPACATGGTPLLAEGCLWPPKHRFVCWTDVASLVPGLAADVRVLACQSDQPDDVQGRDPRGHGDGRAEPDCEVAEDGRGFCVRSERQGGERAGRSYLITLGLDAGCGGEVAAYLRLGVPHDLRDRSGCLRPDPHEFLLRHELVPFTPIRR